jgi:hypothetical protein
MPADSNNVKSFGPLRTRWNRRATAQLGWSLRALLVALVAFTVPLDLIKPIMSEMDEPAWVDVLLAVLVRLAAARVPLLI